MLWLVVFLLFAFFLVIVLLFVRFNALVEYVRNDVDDSISISLYAMKGNIKYKYEIPLIDVGYKGSRFRLVKEAGKKEREIGKGSTKLGPLEIWDKYLDFRAYYVKNSEFICNLRDYIRDHFVLANFDLFVKQGTGNAANTGVVNGVLWAAAGILTSYLHNNLKIMKERVRIVPNFHTREFKVDLYCIFHTKLVHIIVVVMKIHLNRKHEKHKLKKTIGGDISG